MTDSHTANVAVLIGSLRAGSTNYRLALSLAEGAPEGAHLSIVEGLGELPFYNEDLDGETVPASVTTFRETVAAADAVLVVTPEHNGSVPAVIGNAIDWLSRPYGAGAIVGKPFAVVGTTPTPYGGKWAHEVAVRSAGIAGAQVIGEVTVSQTSIGVDVLTDPEVRAKLLTAIEALVAAEVQAVAA